MGNSEVPSYQRLFAEFKRRKVFRVAAVYGGGECTHGDAARFFSYRRDGVTGRMACGIWLSN